MSGNQPGAIAIKVFRDYHSAHSIILHRFNRLKLQAIPTYILDTNETKHEVFILKVPQGRTHLNNLAYGSKQEETRVSCFVITQQHFSPSERPTSLTALGAGLTPIHMEKRF